MTLEVPRTELLSDNQKGKQASTEEIEPALNIQIEEPHGVLTGEELMTSSEVKPIIRKKGVFNNPFHKGTKKDTDEVASTSDESPGANERRTSKVFEDFLFRIKVRMNSHDIY